MTTAARFIKKYSKISASATDLLSTAYRLNSFKGEIDIIENRITKEAWVVFADSSAIIFDKNEMRFATSV